MAKINSRKQAKRRKKAEDKILIEREREINNNSRGNASLHSSLFFGISSTIAALSSIAIGHTIKLRLFPLDSRGGEDGEDPRGPRGLAEAKSRGAHLSGCTGHRWTPLGCLTRLEWPGGRGGGVNREFKDREL